MIKNIIGSKVDLNDLSNPLVQEFHSYVDDILENDEIKKLDTFYQHVNTTRLQHSMNVAYYTFLTCKKLNLKTRDATRAALLHDFFLYDWHLTTFGYHPAEHPRQALINAKKHFEVSEVMEDAILKHMWPVSFNWPKHMESWVVTFADKACATMEIFEKTKEAKENKYVTTYEGYIDK